MATCEVCGADQEPGHRFCRDCGSPLTLACPSCGAPATAGARFCADCGRPLSATGAGAAPAAPAVPAPRSAGSAPVDEQRSQRRVCSVLFCDLVGFTPLSESRDPEEVRELLSRYASTARTVIERHGGAVEKFIGDAVMAVWGTPVATEGDAERAVRAGLELVSAVADLGIEVGLGALAARAGIVTGEVAVTLGAIGEGMVAGDAVNTAARVQSAAGAGTVLVDDTTRRLAGSAIGFDDAGAHELKGKTAPQRLWRATWVQSRVGGTQRVDGLEAPMTGRDVELRLVKELFHAVADRAVPRLVVVSGPAGVGKSRLGWEFEKYVDGLAETVWWHRGRCLSYGEGVTFWALAEIVRQRLGIAEEDAAETARQKLLDGLVDIVPDLAERAYVGLRLARLLGVTLRDDSGAALSREELFAGWRLFFERLAATGPVALLVEDAQYADSALLDFLDHLVDWSRDLPIVVLVFTRPELDNQRPGLGSGRNRATVSLDPLDPASMEALVDALVPGMPAAARTAITTHAQGIPLFAAETVRSLIDRDVVQPVEGTYRLVGDVGRLAVPDSLHSLLAARLDALEPAVRALAADAAVLGTTFSAEALRVVAGSDEPAVRAALAELVRRQVLDVAADPLSPERGSYRFSQAMLRQVAYDTLSRRDRKSRHLAVAAHLRATFAEDGEAVMDVVARHYTDALAAVPEDPDTPQIRLLAVDALTRAADQAQHTGAPGRAATSFALAAELLDDADGEPGDTDARRRAAGCWARAAQAAGMAGSDIEGTLAFAERARERYVALGDARAAARAQATAGQAQRNAGRLAEARELLTAALDVLRAEPALDTVEALSGLAAVEAFAGSPDGDRLSVEALRLGQDLDVEPGMTARLLVTRGNWLASSDSDSEAAAYLREAARLAELAGDVRTRASALLNLSDLLAVRSPALATEAGRSAAELARHGGFRNLLRIAITNTAAGLLATGDWDAAAAELHSAVSSDGLSDDLLTCYQAQLAAFRGDAETARALLDGLGGVRDSDDPQTLSLVAVAEAVTGAAERRPAAALASARRVLAHADALGMTAEMNRWAWVVASRAAYELGDTDATAELLAAVESRPRGRVAPMVRAERELVLARLAAGDAATDARQSFAAALTALRQEGTPYQLAHGLADQAEYLDRTGSTDEAARAREEARSIAERLGCRLVLDRLAAAAPQERGAQAVRG